MKQSFYENMAVMYVNYYNKNGEEKLYNFVLTTKVSLVVLTTLYAQFIKDGIEPMDKLPQEQKEKFWNVACKYFDEMGDRLKASKSCYVLSLLTAN